MARYTDYPDVTLARNLKRLCAEKDIKQKDLASICGKERKSASNWVNCVSSPSSHDLKIICMRYDISADELLGLKRTKGSDY